MSGYVIRLSFVRYVLSRFSKRLSVSWKSTTSLSRSLTAHRSRPVFWAEPLKSFVQVFLNISLSLLWYLVLVVIDVSRLSDPISFVGVSPCCEQHFVDHVRFSGRSPLGSLLSFKLFTHLLLVNLDSFLELVFLFLSLFYLFFIKFYKKLLSLLVFFIVRQFWIFISVMNIKHLFCYRIIFVLHESFMIIRTFFLSKIRI